ncbi:MAG: primosomal protein N' [Gallionellales bacterium RIFCSPLOWO2_12_FULL_59_22]|nr:MAG: primosomal protein N' [Gallionellales bacterium RIFCSPLOWO2_02_FULL_59_110]OGT02799.1 MAG: primosomal protein N' [Gallionellales bacterium RIFCSPLOWO2_02_58_13]OGT14464.1 MAG: primosomal protein N' [Gallionellales bacterium RIFCSPLOWO2_12_FULL_59_22]
MPIVRVALDVPLSTLFDYTVEASVAVGQRVIVPFGRRQMAGVVMECLAKTDVAPERIKPVKQVLHDSLPLSAELLDLLRFCSDYYRYPIGQTVLSALPVRLRSDKPIVGKPVLSYRLSAGGAALDLEKFPKRKVVQRRILAKLAEQPCNLAQLKSLSATAGKQLKTLEAEGWVEHYTSTPSPTLPMQRGGGFVQHTFDNAHTLTCEQQQAVDAVSAAQGYACFLLHGITGSGKTEVYVHLMHEVLQRGGQVLLLVPEINLTPQLENYFYSRFPDVSLTSLHSGLSENERLHNWQQAQAGVARIVLGTRLAVFAELPNLALIIVDEEHDSSFKQQDGLRYSARDVAIFRANQRGVPIVLGSATPSLESYHNAQSGRYRMLRLTGRALAEARLPAVRCININQTVMHHGISENLLREIGQRIARREQSLLFINRRGYAPVLMCGGCGWLSGCKNCAGKMVLHLNDKRLRCHHCGYQLHVPHACPSCGDTDLHPVGSGTQRVESVLQERFPEARILRVDRDSTRNKRAWQAMRERIHANEVDILVGTQMLAKGHDFPALTLVGVLNPDGALYSSDFRAAEKLFAQLAQVAGRAGRSDKPGEVLIQTAFPDHPLFRALRAHDFEGWAAAQLAERRMACFPPFVYQAMLRAEGKNETEVYAFLHKAHAAALGLERDVEVFGVVPAALPRRANHIRAQLLVQGARRKVLQTFVRDWQPLLDALPAQKLRWSLDVDPAEF